MIALFASQAHVGGLYLNDFATPSVGTAGASAQAWADNASTAFFNSAGMTRISGNQFMLGGGVIVSDVKFEASPDTPVAGGGGGNAGGIAPGIDAAYVHTLSGDRFGSNKGKENGSRLD